MFKRGSIETELMRSMEKELVDYQFESQQGFGKLAKAVDHLNAAATLFDKAGMVSVALDISELLKLLDVSFETCSGPGKGMGPGLGPGKGMGPGKGKGYSGDNWEDYLSGGLADKYVPEDFDSKTLQEGIEVEKEHTKDSPIAAEIAMDHMVETKKPGTDPIESDYYKELAKLEEKLEK